MCTLRSDSTESRWGWLRGSSMAMSHFPSGRVNDRSLESSQAAHLVLSTSQTASKFFFRLNGNLQLESVRSFLCEEGRKCGQREDYL